MEMVTETPTVPVIVLDEVAPGETHLVVNVEAPNPEQESPSVASSGGDFVKRQIQICQVMAFSDVYNLERQGIEDTPL